MNIKLIYSALRVLVLHHRKWQKGTRYEMYNCHFEHNTFHLKWDVIFFGFQALLHNAAICIGSFCDGECLILSFIMLFTECFSPVERSHYCSSKTEWK